MKKTWLLWFAAFLLTASVASAQTLTNPTKVEFIASADHSAIASYELGWFLGTATTPVSVLDIGKPTPDPVTNLCTATINVMPLAFNEYTAKARAKVSATVYSEWSVASNPFTRAPGPPGGPTVKK